MAEDVKVPEGWRKVRLGEIGKIVSGSTPDTANPNFWNGDIVWITPDDLSKLKTMYIPTSSRKLTKEGLRSSSAKLILPYSIVLSSRAPIGYVAISTVSYTTNQGCKSIIPHESYNPEFLYYCLQRYIKEIVALGSGTTFTEISKSQLEKLKVILPVLLPEQRKIAEILETVDNAIEKTGRIIEKYKRIKQGLMQDLLTRGIAESDELGVMSYELRDEKKHRFKDSLLGRIPEEWEVVELGEVFKLKSGMTRPCDTSESGNYPIYGGNGILGYTNEKNFDIETIIIGRVGEYCGVVYIASGGWVTDNALYVVVKKRDYNNLFLCYLLNYVNLNQYSAETGQPLMTQSIVYKIQIPLPPLPEQKRIASILSQIDEAIEKEKKYKEKLERIKRGLMEDLLTGKVRVNHLIEEGVELPQEA